MTNYGQYAEDLYRLRQRRNGLGLGRFFSVLLISGGGIIWYVLNTAEEGAAVILFVILAVSFVVMMLFNYQRAKVSARMYALLSPLDQAEKEHVVMIAAGSR